MTVTATMIVDISAFLINALIMGNRKELPSDDFECRAVPHSNNFVCKDWPTAQRVMGMVSNFI